MKSLSLPKLKSHLSLAKGLIILLLGLLLVLGAAPGYLSGRFTWTHPPHIKNLSRLRNIRQSALEVKGWQTRSQTTDTIGGQQWSIQELTPADSPQQQAVLLLFPQSSMKAQPEVQWMDIKGYKDWQTDQQKILTLTVDNAQIQANFFRGWNTQQTHAVLQWYAWPQGGHPSPIQWFWADQQAQWQGRRLPWVAVSILIPIEPLGEISSVEPKIKALGQAVQAALTSGPMQQP